MNISKTSAFLPVFLLLFSCSKSNSPGLPTVKLEGELEVEENKTEHPEEQKLEVRYLYQFPTLVENMRRESIVGVEVSILKIVKNKWTTEENASTGFIVGKNRVLTAAHILGDYPAVWTSRSTKIKIFCEADTLAFEADLIKINWEKDLAEIAVKSNTGHKFSGPAVTFANLKDEEKVGKNTHLYSFKAVTTDGGQLVFFPLKLETILMVTNFAGDDIKKYSSGMLQGVADSGTSGAPLIGADGKIYGVILSSTPAYLWAASLKDILEFLQSK